MTNVESGSDGENGEKPVRERLKQTKIDKTSAHTSQTEERLPAESLEKPSIVEPKLDGVEVLSDSKKRGIDDAASKDPNSEHGNESQEDNADTSLRKRAKEDISELVANNGNREAPRTASPDARGISPQRPTRSVYLEQALASPRRKRSRESLDVDEETREQKIPSTEETRARRSSSEERQTGAESQGNTQGASTNAKLTDSAQPIFGATLKPKPMEKAEEKPQTSNAAFAASGFASLSGAASPFGNLGSSSASGSKSPETQPALSSFASPKPPSNTFGSSFASAPSSFASAAKLSGFGSLGGSAFGGGKSAFGSGPKLTSFAASKGDAQPSNKKAEKPFGAPDESDDGSDGESEVSEEASGDDPPAKDPESPSTKFHVQEVHTGEDNENSVFTNRAKLFQFHSDTSSWKERGVGPIKVNVERLIPSDTGDQGAADSSANPEASKASNGRSRLLMRNHATHKVILNAPIYKEMTINEQTSKQLLFICPNEVGKMTTYMLRMSKEDDIRQLHKTVKDLQDKIKHGSVKAKEHSKPRHIAKKRSFGTINHSSNMGVIAKMTN